MTLTSHQPAYIPWLGLIDKIAQADTFCLLDTVQYLPKEFQNRNRIKTPAGPIWLSVPVLRKGYRDKPLDEIRIDNRQPWQRKHWAAITQNYGRAPYFDVYAPWLEVFYRESQWETLAQLDEVMLRWFLLTLGVKTSFLRASDYDFQGVKSGLVLDMCRQLGATTYIFGALGRDYADVPAFDAAGVEVRFQDYAHPTYPQQHGGFVPNLSVLDLLLNCGPRSLEVIRRDYRVLA